jgi:phage-related minor tail protein
MNDLEKAKHALYGKELTLAIVKNGEVLFETRSHRISGFLGAIEQLGEELEGASLADRVAGKAIALLCVYAKIKEVYAEVLSRKAKIVLEQNVVHDEWKELVDNVLDLNKKGVCPFEKAAERIVDPKDAYRIFKALQESLKTCK